MKVRERDLGATSPSDAADGALGERTAGGALSAFEELFLPYYSRIYRLCNRIGRPENADDAVQEVFLRAFQRMGSFRPGAAVWPWLATITKHVVIDQYRRAGRELVCDNDIVSSMVSQRRTTESADVAAVANDELAALRTSLVRALESIPERDRNLVWLRLADDHSFEDIARRFDTTVHGVRNSIWRARRILMPMLEAARNRWRLPAIPILVLDGMRRLRTKLRSVNYRLQRIGEVAFYGETSAAFGSALAVVVVIVSSVIAQESPRDGRTQKPAVSSFASVARLASVTTKPSPMQELAVKAPVPRVSSSVGKTKPHRAAPESGRFGVGLVGPDGQTLYWLETDYQCDDNGTELVPPDSPIKAAC